MIRNYFKIAWRNFARSWGYTTLNLIGLAIGMAACLLIMQYVTHELSFDQFHTNGDDIYRIRYDFYSDGERRFKCSSAFPGVGPDAKAEFPEVIDYARLHIRYGGGVVRYNDISIKEDYLFMADQSFLNMFSYEWVEGDQKNALVNPNTAVISENVVDKYFHGENPIGKRIKFGSREEYEIVGIARSPENSHIKFHFLFSYPTMAQWGDWVAKNMNSNWGWYDFHTYVQLAPEADYKALEAKLPAFIDKYDGRENASERIKFLLQPLKEIHLYSDLIQEIRVNGDGKTVYFLLIIAIFILVIAWINYVNLATARAMGRAKEVGIRKVVGAQKGQLIRQFLFESVLMNFVAAVLAVLLLELSIPFFNELTNLNLQLNLLTQHEFWLALVGLFVLGTLLSGVYPAFVLSGYRPISVLKGKLATSHKGVGLRKGLVLFQFAASAFLIAGTIIVSQQLSFMRNQDLGIQIDQTLVIKGPGVVANDSLFQKGHDGFKSAMLNHPEITHITGSSEIPGNLIYWTNGGKRLEAPDNSSTIIYNVGIDYNFIEGFDHQILVGRNYDESFGTDRKSVILNETAINVLGFESIEKALDQKVRIGGDTLTIVGIVEDYHQQGLKQGFDPTAFRLSPRAGNYYSVKISTTNLPETLAFAEDTYRSMFPNNPFDFFFLDDFFNKQYQSETTFGKAFGFFAILAILVACLGLIGLSAFSASQRVKEISIRKVLGSSVSNIFLLLSKDFFQLVLIANVIAIPFVWYFQDQWLEGFAFQTEISWWVYVLAGFVTLAIAILTISYQSVKAAHLNPADVLRNE